MKLPGIDEQTKSAEVIVNDQGAGPQIKTAPVPARPFDLESAQNKLNAWEGKAIQLKTVATNFLIEDDEDNARAVEMIGQAKALGKDINRAAEAIYIDAYNFQKSVKNIAKTITQHLDAAQGALNKTANAYAYQQELDRRAAEKKAKAEAEAFQKKLDADAKKKDVAPVKMQTAPVVGKPHGSGPVKTQSGSLSTKMVWTFEFTDFKTQEIFDYVLKVCSGEYIKVAEKAIGKMIKAGLHENVKGVRFFERAETKHRAR